MSKGCFVASTSLVVRVVVGYTVVVKVLQTGDIVNVVFTNRQARAAGKHVAWPNNAVAYLDIGVTKGDGPDAAQWYVNIDFTLLDGNSYRYYSRPFGSDDDAASAANDWIVSAGFFEVDNITGAFGEWFNYVARPQFGGKRLLP